MKKMTTIIALALCLQGFAQYDPDAKAVLDAMSARYKQMQGYTASFNQKLTNESAGIEESIDGIHR